MQSPQNYVLLRRNNKSPCPLDYIFLHHHNFFRLFSGRCFQFIIPHSPRTLNTFISYSYLFSLQFIILHIFVIFLVVSFSSSSHFFHHVFLPFLVGFPKKSAIIQNLPQIDLINFMGKNSGCIQEEVEKWVPPGTRVVANGRFYQQS